MLILSSQAADSAIITCFDIMRNGDLCAIATRDFIYRRHFEQIWGNGFLVFCPLDNVFRIQQILVVLGLLFGLESPVLGLGQVV